MTTPTPTKPTPAPAHQQLGSTPPHRLESGNRDGYLKRCLATLRDWDAPLTDWYCVDMIDYGQPGSALAVCELCGCTQVRFIHVMAHRDHPKHFHVGCICAGVMEGDELAAKDRERKMRNRSKRCVTFLKKKWTPLANGNRMLRHKGQRIFINSYGNRLGINVAGTRCWEYCGKPITTVRQACLAAFDLVDPKDW